VIFDWSSFALGALACIAAQWLWAACHLGGFVLRLMRRGHIADLLGTLLMWALVIAAGFAAVWAVNEALFLTAVSIRRGVY
jgi:hypothetical protein